MKTKLPNPKAISRQIEEYRVSADLTYVEATVDYCNIHNIDFQSVSALLTKNFKTKLEREGKRHFTLKKTPRKAA